METKENSTYSSKDKVEYLVSILLVTSTFMNIAACTNPVQIQPCKYYSCCHAHILLIVVGSDGSLMECSSVEGWVLLEFSHRKLNFPNLGTLLHNAILTISVFCTCA